MSGKVDQISYVNEQGLLEYNLKARPDVMQCNHFVSRCKLEARSESTKAIFISAVTAIAALFAIKAIESFIASYGLLAAVITVIDIATLFPIVLLTAIPLVFLAKIALNCWNNSTHYQQQAQIALSTFKFYSDSKTSR